MRVFYPRPSAAERNIIATPPASTPHRGKDCTVTAANARIQVIVDRTRTLPPLTSKEISPFSGGRRKFERNSSSLADIVGGTVRNAITPQIARFGKRTYQ